MCIFLTETGSGRQQPRGSWALCTGQGPRGVAGTPGRQGSRWAQGPEAHQGQGVPSNTLHRGYLLAMPGLAVPGLYEKSTGHLS